MNGTCNRSRYKLKRGDESASAIRDATKDIKGSLAEYLSCPQSTSTVIIGQWERMIVVDDEVCMKLPQEVIDDTKDKLNVVIGRIDGRKGSH